ncbi:GNAT family N-acetyltransferase [Paenibacillus sp. CC-CFT747]|nr:GNAT family N-acetyltransferase [Paenibacillus sp. CC-CFT747]
MITTERLELIPFNPVNVEEVSRQYPIGPHVESYLERLEEDPEEMGWGVWYVVDKMTRQVIGDLGFKGKPSGRTVEVGYGFLPEVHNRGYATEAVKALLTWAFSTGQVDRVTAECLQDNPASRRVLEKAGFVQTGSRDSLLDWEIDRESWSSLS